MRSRSNGFTLIEVMIAVVIIAILASIAYPSYMKYTVKTRRAAAGACLMERAQFMERYYSTNLGYTGAAIPATGCVNELAGFYTFSAPAGLTGTAYSISAVPQGVQATKDTECATMTINQSGTKTASGSLSSTPEKCF